MNLTNEGLTIAIDYTQWLTYIQSNPILSSIVGGVIYFLLGLLTARRVYRSIITRRKAKNIDNRLTSTDEIDATVSSLASVIFWPLIMFCVFVFQFIKAGVERE